MITRPTRPFLSSVNALASAVASLVVFGALAGSLAGCASSGSASSTKPGEPVALEGARYKLLAAGGQLDGRVVEFLQRGDTVVGCLAEPGPKLRGATGIDTGLRVFSMSKKANNEWEGVYRAVGGDGSITDKPVSVSFDGDTMTWNLESATWERQSGSPQLSDDQKKQCTGK
jgi:hypothetical protein